MKSAIARITSVAIVVLVIIAAFSGYLFGHNVQLTSSVVTSTNLGPVSSISSNTITQTDNASTVTEYVVVVGVYTVTYEVSGSCSFEVGPVSLSISTTTTYFEPSNSTRYLSTTTTSTTSEIALKTTSTYSGSGTTSGCTFPD